MTIILCRYVLQSTLARTTVVQYLLPNGAADPKLSPVIAQYSAIKAQNPGSLLFYRTGDFHDGQAL
jgi:hypothetical protein